MSNNKPICTILIGLDKLETILNEKPILLDNRPQNRN